MTDNTSAALIASLDVKFDQLASNMKKAITVFDNGGRQIEKRQAQIKKNLSNWAIKLPTVVAGGAALLGIEKFVTSIVEAGSKIKDTSDAIGVGTDEIQAWGLLADRAGTNQEDFNVALQKFAKNLGDAAIKGGDAAKMYRALGVDVHAGPTAAFYELADAVQKSKDPAQRVELVTQQLGKTAAKLTPVLAQGSAALKAQTADLVKSGQVIQSSAIDKLDDLGDAWSDLKRQFKATGGNALAEPLSKFTESLRDPQVLSGIKTFATLLAEVAVAAAKVAKYAPIIAGIWAGAKLGRFAGPEGALAGAAIGGVIGGSIGGVNTQTDKQIQNRINSLQQSDPNGKISSNQQEIKRLQGILAERASAQAAAAADAAAKKTGARTGADGGIDRSDLLGKDLEKRKEGARQLADFGAQGAKDVRDATLKANEDIRSDNLDTAEARRNEIRAQDQALLQLNEGTSGYFDLQKEVIAELARLDIGSINDRRDAELAALAARSAAADQEADEELKARKRQLDELVEQEKITRAQADQSLSNLSESQDEARAQREAAAASRRVALEQTAADQIVSVNQKKNADLAQADEDLTHTRQNLIALNDGVRQGLIDIGTASLHGFGAMKDAAAQALEQVAQLILQLYVLEPLVKGLLGPAGTSGGGFIGTVLHSVLGGIGGGGGDVPAAGFNADGSMFFGADGGYTGQGPKNKFAGFVHKGEVVWSQADIREAGGLGVVEAMRRGVRGYADGGPVGMLTPSISRLAARSGPSPVYFDLRGAVVTEQLLDQMNQISHRHATEAGRHAYSAAVIETNRQFPVNLSNTLRDKA